MDSDGYAAGMIVYLYLKDKKVKMKDISFTPINYGMELPDINYDSDKVYIVDFCLQPAEVMVELTQKLGDRLVWIDHHGTSVLMEIDNPEILAAPGLRQVNGTPRHSKEVDTPISGCELTWRYFYKDSAIPEVLNIIGDWDTWRHTKMSEEDQEKAKSLQYVFKSIETNPNTKEGRAWWEKTFAAKDLEELIESGYPLLEYQKRQWYGLLKSRGFTAKIKDYTAIMVNQGGNSEMFNGFYDEDKHDIMVTYQEVKGRYLTVSIYTTKTDKINVGKLAKELGEAGDIPSGGGHAGAAGFQCTWEYFKTLFTI